ncbi:hypothetical protein GCM10007298_38100 [Williamsia phyllosphaerae]|uniref:DNA-binding protein n=1 Tax=Williamsia phyllosphaerae TaxID=885042 RepID=A0ABQ1V790_9NOCA|nr:hypothetical protein GCM10007298_38100 [Williamsia phyllosphaerae]
MRGFSYADLETRAGAVITRQRWQQLGTGVRIKEFPEPATLEAMSKALDADVAEVVLAAARSLGLNVQRGAQSDLAARLPSTSDRLNEVQRDAIVTLVRSITEQSNAVEAEAEPAASGEASEGEKNLDEPQSAAASTFDAITASTGAALLGKSVEQEHDGS